MKLSRIIKETREKKGITLKDLSKMSNVGVSTISDIETGKAVNPRIETLVNLSKVLNINLSVLLEDYWEDMPEESEEVRAIARDVQNLSLDNRKLLLKMIESMKEIGKEAKK